MLKNNNKNYPEDFNRTQTLTTQCSKCPVSKITWLTKKQQNVINSQGKNNQQMPTKMNQMLELSVRDFIVTIITVLYEMTVNTIERSEIPTIKMD